MSTRRYDFSQHTNNDIRNTAKLLYMSSSKYGGDWHSTPHTHHCSELFFVTGGSGQFFIENKIYPISANDLILVNPHVSHTEIGLAPNPLEYIVLGIEGLELAVMPDAEENFCIVNLLGIRDIFLGYLKNLLRELENQVPGYEVVCQNLTEILIILLTRQTNFEATLAPIRKKSTHLSALVRRYIDTHYKENINLDMLADKAHVNKYYMVHTFTKEYGVSPIKYMISKRIEESCQLLQTTDYSLSTISRMLGFSSPSYFSQTFKKEKNCSPLEYRKSNPL